MIPFRTTIPVRRFGLATLLTLSWCIGHALAASPGVVVALLAAWYMYVLMPPAEEHLGTAWFGFAAAVCAAVSILTWTPLPLFLLWVSFVLGTHVALHGGLRVRAIVPFFHLFWPVVEVPSVPFVVLWFPIVSRLVPAADTRTEVLLLLAATAAGFLAATVREWWSERQTRQTQQAIG